MLFAYESGIPISSGNLEPITLAVCQTGTWNLMKMNDKIRKKGIDPERYVWALVAAWSIIAAASLAWNVARVKQEIIETGRIHARISYAKDIIYRHWNAKYGGVYVPVSEDTQPNPYLSHIPDRDIKTPSGKLLTLANPYRMLERDIRTPSGKLLTLMNPAYMTRKVLELGEKEHGILGHITSLKPIRPENAPDSWETRALQAFEQGKLEVSSRERIQGKDYMRLMRPLITEKECLSCHAVHGYKVGDVRGGISVSVPMEPLWANARRSIVALSLGHIMLWLIGLGGIVIGTKRLRKSQREQNRAEDALRESLRLNELLLDSLPNPVMLIRSDRTVLAANYTAREVGTKVGDYCWRGFGNSEYIPDDHKCYLNEHNGDIPPGGTKCTFCLADKMFEANKTTNNPEVEAFGQLWDTWWVPVENDVFLHYAINITERKQAERELILK